MSPPSYPFTPEAPAAAIGDLLAGKYRIERLLGRGGMGAVFLAENIDIGRKVAIKILHASYAAHPDAAARFRNEARAAAAIGHPSIIDVLDLGTTDEGSAFIVMERLEGETFGDRVRHGGPLGFDEAALILDQVFDALAAAHEKGIVHRDLKPENVFLTRRPGMPVHVKLLDFGISKFSGEGASISITQTGEVMGTPLYMSPEQARGARDVGPSTDIYSAGAMLYESLAGRPPFTGTSYNEVIAKVLMDPPDPLLERRPDTPPSLLALIEALLAKDPADRPASAMEARALLRQSMANHATDVDLPTADTMAGGGAAAPRASIAPLAATRPEPRPPTEARRAERRRVLPIIVLAIAGPALALVAIVAVMVIVTRRAHPPADAPPPIHIRVDTSASGAPTPPSVKPSVTPRETPPVVSPPVAAKPPAPMPAVDKSRLTSRGWDRHRRHEAAPPAGKPPARTGITIEEKNPYED